jgi:hypothetical protein
MKRRAQVALDRGDQWARHCEERSDVAIQRTWARYVPLDGFAIARPEGRVSFDALMARNDDRNSARSGRWLAQECGLDETRGGKKRRHGRLVQAIHVVRP